jgi:lactoylglutathione lyase
MIKGLFETHLFVSNLNASVEFYKNTLGLELCRKEDDRKVAFFWIGQPQSYMLGIWEKPVAEVQIRHFAFRCDVEDVLYKAENYLIEKDLKPYNFFNDGSTKPMVFAWMPAIAIYFNDPDGHVLEFIAILDGTPKPDLGIITYDTWLAQTV